MNVSIIPGLQSRTYLVRTGFLKHMFSYVLQPCIKLYFYGFPIWNIKFNRLFLGRIIIITRFYTFNFYTSF